MRVCPFISLIRNIISHVTKDVIGAQDAEAR